MKTLISRTYTPKETLGKLIVFDGIKMMLNIASIELPWLDNQLMVSCIPEGKYTLQKYNSPKHGWCFIISGVEGRTGIELHIGNFATGKKVDTCGCVLPGMYFADINMDGNLDVVDSGQAMEKLLALLPDESELHIL